MGVKLQSSSGGSVDITAPVTASNYTLTAPATSSTIDTLARTGNVLQVVQGTYSTEAASSSATYADTGLTATITPTSASSKVLVIVHQNGVGKSSNNTYVNLKLVRGATDISMFGFPVGNNGSTGSNSIGSTSTAYLDNPNTVSAVTYKTQFASTGIAIALVQWSSVPTSTITLMEIAG